MIKLANMLSKLVFSILKQESKSKKQDLFLSKMLSLVLAPSSWPYARRLHFRIGPVRSKRFFFGPVLKKLSVLILLVACGSYPKKNNLQETEIASKEILNPYFSDSSKDYVYKARIMLQKKEFGGLFIVKKLGANSHRVVFTTEMGNKILDFSFRGDAFTINYLLEEMNKKVLINTLKMDFRAVIAENPPILETFVKNDQDIFEAQNDKKKYYYFYKGGQLEKIIRTSGKKEKTEYLFLETRDDLAERIEINHKNIPLQITLNAI